MTKKIYIIRHAKSRYALSGESDFIRPLNITGFKDVQKMASRLHHINDTIDTILCSSALRTRETASRFCVSWKFDQNKIIYLDELYHASSETIFNTISQLDDKLRTAVIIAHNPGITDFVNQMNETFYVDDVPTCGVAGIEAACDEWKEFRESERKLIFFGYPNQKNNP
jgi:phosphohistidine phosphatase